MQTVVVILILCIAALFVGRRFYRSWKTRGGCGCGCSGCDDRETE
jgi:hypothetical protein